MSNKSRLKKKKPLITDKGKSRLSGEQLSLLSDSIQTAIHFHQAGNFRQAAEYYHRALAIDPNNPEANTHFGTLYYQAGNPAAAIPFIERAIQHKPDYVEAYNILGNIYHTNGQCELAVKSYRKALSYKPDYAMLYNNMGIVLEAMGNYPEALDNYRKAIDIQPGYADAYANQGIVFWFLGRIDDAIKSYSKALLLKPNFPDGYRNFALLMKSGKVLPSSVGSLSDRKKLLVNCLSRSDVGPQSFFRACLNELLQEDTREEIDKFLSAKDITDLYDRFTGHSGLSQLLSDRLFLLMLKKILVANQFAEKFLVRLREVLLTTMAIGKPNDQSCERLAPLACALAMQCFWNEYLYPVTESESGHLLKVAELLLSAPSFATPKAIVIIALLGCYAPLSSYEFAEKISDNSLSGTILADVVRTQFLAPRQEKELLTQIQSFSEISDEVSVQVKQQYEENPYPRWTGISLGAPMPFVEFFRQEIMPNHLADLTGIDRPEVLIAGCGTGQQPISCAATYLNSSVTAIDLSFASLAYAKRKANEIGMGNIEFIQGDILELGRLGKRFDVIECSGVLHHMSAPEAGFRVLADLLKPSGYMKIALYSESARQHIVAAREFVETHGFPPTSEGIRTCRQALFDLPDTHKAKLVTVGEDFYSTSTVRDLIFHVQEHRFTLPEIAEILDKLHLEFLGFSQRMELKRSYLAEFGDDCSAVSLTNWHLFEQKYPGTFFEMYNFWVRKKKSI